MVLCVLLQVSDSSRPAAHRSTGGGPSGASGGGASGDGAIGGGGARGKRSKGNNWTARKKSKQR